MKKRKNIFSFVFILIISFSALLTIPTTSNASEIEENIKHISIEKNQPIGDFIEQPADQITPNFVNPYRYSKENVTKRTYWTPYRRISDDLETGPAGGSLVANKTTTFKSSASGAYNLLGLDIGASASSTKGYILNVAGNKKQYMGYRARMEEEKGTRVRTDVVTGQKVRQSYTFNKVLYGRYGLLNAPY